MHCFILLCVTLVGMLRTSFSFGFIKPIMQVAKSRKSSLLMEYIPDGLTKEQWEKMKIEEAKRNEGKGGIFLKIR